MWHHRMISRCRHGFVNSFDNTFNKIKVGIVVQKMHVPKLLKIKNFGQLCPLLVARSRPPMAGKGKERDVSLFLTVKQRVLVVFRDVMDAPNMRRAFNVNSEFVVCEWLYLELVRYFGVWNFSHVTFGIWRWCVWTKCRCEFSASSVFTGASTLWILR